ncbi:MAG: prolyl aminopeptidase [Fimbriimonadales bacterium]
MAQLYPVLEPYDHGLLDVGDGHLIYWEACGNPNGKSAVVLHGGPGSGCSVGNRRPFNPALYRIVLFDQRGCGRSSPHAACADVDLSTNSTEQLLGDIEALRGHLGIERWLVFGGSWGSTLALAYAERHPDRVSEMVLAAVTTTARWEVSWITEGIGQYFPEALAKFRAGVPDAEPGGRLVDAYHRLLMSPDPDVHSKAARDWCDWEMAIVALGSDQKPNPRYELADFRLAFARIVTHYFRNNAWIEEGSLLREAHRLSGIPGIMIHGRLDLGCPLITPWRLADAWPGSRLVILDEAGHDRGPGMTEAVVEATDRFANRHARLGGIESPPHPEGARPA